VADYNSDVAYVATLSWVHEDFPWQQTAPPTCPILVLLEPPLLVQGCLFARKVPAYFAANFYI